MKAQTSLSLELSLIDEIRSKAAKCGMTMTDLVTLLIKFGLSKITDEAAQKWMALQPSIRGRTGGGMTKNEKLVFGALERLTARDPAVYRFGCDEVAAEAGLRLSDCYWALKQLQGRTLVKGADFDELDRWGRPVKSIWRLATSGTQP